MEKGLTLRQKCDTILPVSERKNNTENIMRDSQRAISEGIRKRAEKGGDMSVLSVLPWLKDEKTVLVSCCGCNEELRISQHEADQWTDTDWFQCHECE
jgi:hypothetical protein|tara:strand:+ start:302 stop:595 length:294 start_codon:yes stop_codon:yes gene_type:complete